MQLGEDEPATLFYFKHAQVGDDEVNHSQGRDRQRTLFQNFWTAVPGSMLHYCHNTLHSSQEIHRPTGPFDHLARNHPIRDIAIVGYLECAENGEIDVPAANHGKRISAGEIGRAGNRRDRLFAGVDQVGVNLVFGRERADPEKAVFRLQRHVHSFGNVIGHQRRDADAEIDVVTVAQFLRSALRQQLTDRILFFRSRAPLHSAKLDAFFVAGALDDTVDEDARRVDPVWIKLADLDELLDFGNADLAATGDHRVEVP